MKKETFVTNGKCLYIVSTPIGNLKDITLRSLDVLNHVDIIVCEDTRITKKLLNHFNISNKTLFSYANHNLKTGTSKIIQMLLNNKSVALVSDAGTPGISDPGAELINECYNYNIKVTVTPGPTSVIAALTLAGIGHKSFYFGGFLENKMGDLTKQLQTASQYHTALVYFISPNKLAKTIPIIMDIFGSQQPLILVREITKIYEEVIHTTAINLLDTLKGKKFLGEIVLIIPKRILVNSPTTEELTHQLSKKLEKNSLKNAVDNIIQEYKTKNITLNKKNLYNLALTLKNDSKKN